MKKEPIKIEVVCGKYDGNLSIYLDDYRILGAKPWGGGSSVCTFNLDLKTVEEIEKQLKEVKKKLKKNENTIRPKKSTT